MRHENKGPVAQSGTIHLRFTAADDIDYVLQTETEKENSAFITQWTRQKHEDALNNEDIYHLIVETARERKAVGYVIVAGLQNENQSIELLRITISHKGNRYGKEAIRLIKKWAFEEKQAHRLWLDVKDHNTRA